MADLVPPKLYLDESLKAAAEISRRPELLVRYNETGSGLDRGSVQFFIDGKLTSGEVKTEDGLIKFIPEHPLDSGLHEVEVVASDFAGNESGKLNVSIVSASAIQIQKAVAYPSPAKSFTKIRYSLSQSAESVKVRIYDTAGKKLYSDSTSSPSSGDREFLWDLRSSRGRTVANGVYLYRIEARGVDGTRSVVTGKVAVLR
jgi:flagellar hook assembly protein FlgD